MQFLSNYFVSVAAAGSLRNSLHPPTRNIISGCFFFFFFNAIFPVALAAVALNPLRSDERIQLVF